MSAFQCQNRRLLREIDQILKEGSNGIVTGPLAASPEGITTGDNVRS